MNRLSRSYLAAICSLIAGALSLAVFTCSGVDSWAILWLGFALIFFALAALQFRNVAKQSRASTDSQIHGPEEAVAESEKQELQE